MKKPVVLKLGAESRKLAVTSLRTWLADSLDEEVSDLQVELLLDHVVADIGPAIYNQGVADARTYMEERVADLDAAVHRDEFPDTSRRRR
jgi:uncharacterized protein (DUF2164 family)